MSTRRQVIEIIRRQIYGDQPSDDAYITSGLVNKWLEPGIAVAAKTNYKDSLSIDGITYVNNSFYTSFKGISVTADEQFVWKVQLPEIPIGIGQNFGISTLQFKSDTNQVSLPCIPLTENQRTYFQGMRPIPNKVLFYYEGQFVYALSTILLSQYTASITMISGGNSSDLDSTVNVPNDYYPVLIEYIKQQLMFQRQVPIDTQNDGMDAINTT